MTRDELTEMIRQEIRTLAFDTLRSGTKEKEEKKQAFKPKGLSEEELEYTLFYGGNKPEEKDGSKIIGVTKINESTESGIPKINSSDITKFEDSFEEMLKEIDGASVVFDKQSNGFSMKMWIGKDGIEAGASGTIELGSKGQLKWAYSLKNGLNVNTNNLIIDKGNKLVLEKIFNHYDSWQKDWRQKLTIQPTAGESSQPSPEPAPGAAPVGGAEEIPAP